VGVSCGGFVWDSYFVFTWDKDYDPLAHFNMTDLHGHNAAAAQGQKARKKSKAGSLWERTRQV